MAGHVSDQGGIALQSPVRAGDLSTGYPSNPTNKQYHYDHLF
jgi:hypothetical protein